MVTDSWKGKDIIAHQPELRGPTCENQIPSGEDELYNTPSLHPSHHGFPQGLPALFDQ